MQEKKIGHAFAVCNRTDETTLQLRRIKHSCVTHSHKPTKLFFGEARSGVSEDVSGVGSEEGGREEEETKKRKEQKS